MKHRSFATEDTPLVNLNARVPRSLWRRVRIQCLRDGKLLRTFITEALHEYMDARKRSVRNPRRSAAA